MLVNNTKYDIDVSNMESESESESGEIVVSYSNTEYHKISGIIAFFVITFPFIVGDLFYGYNDQSFVYVYPYNLNLNINMQLYLFVSAYVSISIVTYLSIVLASIFYKKHAYCQTVLLYSDAIVIFGSFILFLFMSAWHIIGSIIYFCVSIYLFQNNICDRGTSTYLLISLIIKDIFYMIVFVVVNNGHRRLK
jgi:hypothetical protein